MKKGKGIPPDAPNFTRTWLITVYFRHLGWVGIRQYFAQCPVDRIEQLIKETYSTYVSQPATLIGITHFDITDLNYPKDWTSPFDRSIIELLRNLKKK